MSTLRPKSHLSGGRTPIAQHQNFYGARSWAMLEHVAVAAVCVPFQLMIGVWNTRRRWLTPGEVRFWGVALFIAVELVYLGVVS